MTSAVILLGFIICAVYVQFRGQVVHERLSRRFSDHSNFLAPINCLFYIFSKVRNQPYTAVEQFPELKVITENWEVFKEEAARLNEAAEIKASEDLDDLGFNSFFRTGWKRFYLKWYGASLKSAKELCPKSVEILESVGIVKGAMFASLPPGARLVKHRDPFAGSLRYHLGLMTPNSDDCFISVDGQSYSWRDGEAVIFDETYIHYAENKSDKDRVILFLDIRRPVWFKPIDWFNQIFSKLVMTATATKNLPGDKVGFLNRAFSYLYVVRKVGKKIKLWNKTVYYFLQYALYIGIIYLIFF